MARGLKASPQMIERIFYKDHYYNFRCNQRPALLPFAALARSQACCNAGRGAQPQKEERYV